MADVYNVINSNVESTAGREYQRKVNNELGKDAFMQILLAQLANQNPLEPMSDTDFIAQMAQFTSLENMQAMASSMAQNNAYSMIGKYVSFINPDTLQEVAGKVNAVFMENGEPRLQVGDFVLKMKGVISVYDASFFAGQTAVDENGNPITGDKENDGTTPPVTEGDD